MKKENYSLRQRIQTLEARHQIYLKQLLLAKQSNNNAELDEAVLNL
jgi:hypothetical protein